jgi:7-cyano-7-deazaguanine synthase in queuosine biosynthesis
MFFNYRKRKSLLMFSGGRDSYLAACKLIEAGFCVEMITFDNGCTHNLERVKDVANTIVKKYGKQNAKYVGIWPVSWQISILDETKQYKTMKELYFKYPELKLYETTCLCCRTAMYVEAIAYAKAKGIPYIAEGARKSQSFFVELDEMKHNYSQLCKKHGIQLIWPVYRLTSDTKRKIEIGRRGLLTKTLEPQCHIGRHQRKELTESERKSLNDFFCFELRPLLDKMIKEDARSIRASKCL